MIKEQSDRICDVITHCKLFHNISERDYWGKVKNAIPFLEECVKELENEPKKMLTARLYREFAVNGNRENYENIYFARRKELGLKTVLEAYYNDGRYMEDILDLCWMILEETSWTLPAHNFNVSIADSLPDFVDNSLDLFLAQTACLISFAYQVLGEKLDEMSKVVTRRIKARVKHDVIEDYLARDDYWWMGFSGVIPNNWNPWITSNVLCSAMIIEDDKETLKRLVKKAGASLDIYLDNYPLDGGCDEGPCYWNQAGQTMLECLYLLNMVTDGAVNCFGEEKVMNTSEYLIKMYLGGGRVVNFADCSLKAPIYSATLFKIGKKLSNDKLCDFAKRTFEENPCFVGSEQALRLTDFITYFDEIANYVPGKGKPECDYWLPGIEVAISKTENDAQKGLFLAAKGGHNDESHNHNDVGNFIVYKNGTPFLIDSGNMTYSKITFSDKRYTLWTTRSVYHNTPSVEDDEQRYGREYKSEDVKYISENGKMIFELDLKNTFGNKIPKWRRSFVFDKSARVISVSEDFDIGAEKEYHLNFLTAQKPEFSVDTLILSAENGEKIEMKFNKNLSCNIEKIDCDDNLIINSWGDKLYRVVLSGIAKEDIIEYTIK